MKTINVIILGAFLALLFPACKKKGCINELATNYNSKAKVDDGSCTYSDAALIIHFEHVINDAEIVLNSLNYNSLAGNKYSVEKLFYFVSNVTVHMDGGADIVIDAVHYIDISDESTLTFETNQDLSPGTYSGISFTFGLDSVKNVNGEFPNAPESNMEWPDAMGGGYHYMKLEGKYDSLATGNIKNYATHVGKTKMTGMETHNYFTVTFDETFTVEGTTEVEAHVIMDVNSWFESPNTYDFNNYDDGIMMNQSAQTVLKENGTDVFSLEEIHTHN